MRKNAMKGMNMWLQKKYDAGPKMTVGTMKMPCKLTTGRQICDGIRPEYAQNTLNWIKKDRAMSQTTNNRDRVPGDSQLMAMPNLNHNKFTPMINKGINGNTKAMPMDNRRKWAS